MTIKIIIKLIIWAFAGANICILDPSKFHITPTPTLPYTLSPPLHRYDNRINRHTAPCWRGLLKNIDDRAAECADIVEQVRAY